jgi:glycine cleavage system aminomethyltransferase T
MASAPGRNLTLFATNDDAHRTAVEMQAAGLRVAAVIDSRTGVEKRGDYRLIEGGQVVTTKGRHGLRQITVSHGGRTEEIETDCLAMSGGWNPSVHLTCHLGARPVWDADAKAFLPAPWAVPGMIPSGACNGAMSTSACLSRRQGGREGGAEDARPERQARHAAQGLGRCRNRRRPVVRGGQGPRVARLRQRRDDEGRETRRAGGLHLRRAHEALHDTRHGARSGQVVQYRGTRASGRHDRARHPGDRHHHLPPALHPRVHRRHGGGGGAEGFRARTLYHLRPRGAILGRADDRRGLWYRPSYLPKTGETHWRQSCDREVRMVREAVGVVDVSTLGKIDIQGPDAAEFLDFVYCNMFSTLKPGRVRYGLMLREDGHVMDDGTTARLGEHHYVMTTTTAAAGQVMTHLEFVHQCLRPDLDVAMISTTEQWAQFSVAGPKARELVNSVIDHPIDDESFPFMACGEVTIHGVKGRLFRISFSGEHAYEIAIPSRYGEALYRDLVARAETLGGGAYGMEALNVLRLEKGFITHSEIHGRVTADDVGMGRMVSAKKDCIGKTASQRPGLSGEHREQLVGLKPKEPEQALLAGAHLFREADAATRVNDQGYVTSVAWSPTMETHIGLGFLLNGRARIGETVRMVDHLRDKDHALRGLRPGLLRPRRRTRPWLT